MATQLALLEAARAQGTTVWRLDALERPWQVWTARRGKVRVFLRSFASLRAANQWARRAFRELPRPASEERRGLVVLHAGDVDRPPALVIYANGREAGRCRRRRGR